MMIALRLVHILAGVFWAGAVFFVASMLLPAMRDSGPAAGPVMRQIIAVRRFPAVATTAALLTVISGIWMYWRDTSISDGAFARSTAGMTYGLGGIAAILTVILAAVVQGPTSKKMGQLSAAIAASGGPPSAEQAATLQKLQARLTFGARAAAALLGITVITMAIARYL